MKNKIVILGAGISGLTTAHRLVKEGFDVTLLESRDKPGGSMQTSLEDGFLADLGPNSGLETTPLIKQIVDEVGLTDKMIYASESSNKRYILRNGQLHALPTSLSVFLSTKLFSLKGKLRLFAEPFIGKSDDGYYQSIAQFVTRRLGSEFYDYAIDPFVSGVFAG
ncbi:MAG: protoporphyrinogen oxidase, partial [Ignavibacteria bacterium]|nr:protoporphyrinogen oxidase [Ignavibacteria bacterium]